MIPHPGTDMQSATRSTNDQPLQVDTMGQALQHRAATQPDGLAFDVEGRTISYGQLFKDAQAASHILAASGLERGDRCALVAPTGLDLLRILFGVQLLGASPVILSTRLPEALLRKRLDICRPQIVICIDKLTTGLIGDHTLLPLSETGRRIAESGDTPEVINHARPTDPAYLQLTSGTTGEPRAAMISHRSLLSNLGYGQRTLGLSSEDILVSWLPLYHDMGLVRFVFGGIYFGCPSYLIQPAMVNFRRWLQTISETRGTISASPDFALRMATRMVDPSGLDLGSLRMLINGGEPVRPTTIDNFEQTFHLPEVVRPAYGLAEATLGVTAVRDEPRRIDAAGHISCGRAYVETELRILGEDGRDQPSGTPGEILVRSDAVFSGYFNDKESTRQVLRDGWLHTGDIGRLDGDGHLYVLGRERAIIKRGGAMIAPREIEEVIDTAKEVRLSAAVSQASPDAGTEEVILVVEVRPAVVPDEAIHAELCERLARKSKQAVGFSPRQILLVRPRTIPVTNNGKIRHRMLAQQIASGELQKHGVVVHEEQIW